MLQEWEHHWTHTEILGGPRTGKSSAIVYGERLVILDDRPLIHIAGGKDDTYDGLVDFVAQANPEYKARFLNLSDGDRVEGYNPFLLPKGRTLSAHVSNLAQYMVPPAGDTSFEARFVDKETSKCFFAFVCTGKEPIWMALRLLDFQNRKDWLTLDIPEQYRYQAKSIASTGAESWEYRAGALRRFLDPFMTSDPIRRMLAAPNPIDIGELYEKGISLFVKATPRGELAEPDGRVVLSSILANIFQVGIENAGRNKPIQVSCDELQLYAPPTMGSILETILSAGFRFTIAHHNESQITDEHLRQSLKSSCGIKLVFAGVDTKAQQELAQLAWAEELNTDWVREPQITFVPNFSEEEFVSHHDGPHGRSTTTAPRFVPSYEEVQTGTSVYPFKDKLSRLAARFRLPKYEAIAILPDYTTEHLRFPLMPRYLPDSPDSVRFKETLGITKDEANRLANLTRSTHADPKPRRKKPGGLHNAG